MEAPSTSKNLATLTASSGCQNPTITKLTPSIKLRKTHPYNSQSNKGNKFEEYPRLIVFNIEENRMLVSKWVYGAEDECCHQGAEERPPQSLEWEVIADLRRTNETYKHSHNITEPKLLVKPSED
jgi:hypothetical protein